MLRRIKVETKQLLFDMLRRMNVVEREETTYWYVEKQQLDLLRRINMVESVKTDTWYVKKDKSWNLAAAIWYVEKDQCGWIC